MKHLLSISLTLLLSSGCGGGGGIESLFSFVEGFAFARKDVRDVFVANATDYQTAIVLTQSGDARTPSLSKSGEHIVFVRGKGKESELALVSSSGGALTSVIKPSLEATGFRQPSFSPDGKRIVFAYDDGAAASIGWVNTDGTDFKKLIGGGQTSHGSPSFTPDGKQILAAASLDGLIYDQIERFSLVSLNPEVVLDGLSSGAQSIANRLVVSPDGKKVAFDAQVSGGVTRVFLFEVASKLVTKLNDYVAEPKANDTFPCWMDETTVAYASDSGGSDNIYRIDDSGTNRKSLVPKAIEPWFGKKKQP
jgi:TolB protein